MDSNILKKESVNPMSEINYDSYCGIYCGACSIMRAYRGGHKDRMAANYVEDRQLKCHGCKSGTLFVNCSKCKIRDCAVSRKVEHCFECPEYPCRNINEHKRVEKILPHLTLNRKNLQIVKESGCSEWLAQQEQYWKCADCQTPFSWYAAKCHNCGSDLSNNTFKLSLLKFAIFKFLLRFTR